MRHGVFSPDQRYDIWLQDPSVDLDHAEFRHSIVRGEAIRFLNVQEGEMVSYISAYVFQDSFDDLYLTVDNPEVHEHLLRLNEDYARGWVSLIDRYHLADIVGHYSVTVRGESSTTTRAVVGPDFIGMIRVNDAIRKLAERYNMTTFEFIRFRLLVNSAFAARQPISWDKTAEEILSDRDKA